MIKIIVPKADLIAKISFTIFIFFSFFPTDMPFQPTLQEIGAEEIGTSNITTQILYITLFLLSSIAAIPIFSKILSLIKKEKALSIFLLWALITTLWSDSPFVSFKRWFQIFTFFWIIIVYLSHFPNLKDLLNIIKQVICLYILITLFTVLAIPGAKDPGFHTWRGMAATKNNLGQIGIVLSIITLIIYQWESKRNQRYLALLLFFLSILITIETISSTSIISLFVFLFVSSIFYLKKQIFDRIGVGYFISFVLIISSLTLFIIVFYFVPQITDLIQGIFGKSETFLDRERLWQVVLWEISNHPFIGCGFQGFWVVDSPKVQLIYNSFIWLPIQGHNGYLDMINEVGIIGFVFFLYIIFRYIKISIQYDKINLWIWFIILPLISSITESILFRASDLNTRFLFISYIFLILQTNEKTQIVKLREFQI